MTDQARRAKLGLALSGGGLRASFFHLGVLRRLAELDLLRQVEVLSTVSGGSIVGALYLLLLKLRLDTKAELDRAACLDIIAELERLLRLGTRKNLRTRLLLNPLGILRVIVTHRTLAQRMGRLYERCLFAQPVASIQARRGWGRAWRPGRMPLGEVRFSPGGDSMAEGLEAYNASHSTKVPSLVLNATCLNSGRDWRFTSVEVGDPVLGYLRRDEIEVLLRFKRLGDQSADVLGRRLGQAQGADERRELATVRWWRLTQDQRARENWSEWPALGLLTGAGEAAQELLAAELGQLRAAKLEAWYLRRGLERTPPVSGGLAAPERVRRFRAVLREMGRRLDAAAATAAPATLDGLMDVAVDLYYARSAEGISWRALRDFDRLTLGDAVAASACFPPVFPPFTILGLYDDRHVATLRLTDGGVFDNVGLTALFEEGCTHLIASDAGGLLEVQARTTAGRLGMMGRIVGILMDDVRGRELETLREKRRVVEWLDRVSAPEAARQDAEGPYPLEGAAFFHMLTATAAGAPDGLSVPLAVTRATAGIRTDLDVFGDAEIAALANQGYGLADRFVRGYLGRFEPRLGWAAATQEPWRREADAARELRVLRVGAQRFFRALRLGALWAWVGTLVAVAAALVVTWDLPVSVGGAGRVVAAILPRVPISADQPVPLGRLLLAFAILALVAAVWPSLVRRVRGLAWLVKWGAALSGNVLWVFLGLPAWIALAASALALVSYLYGREFLRVTRDP